MRLLFSRDPISRNLRRFLFTATAAGALACLQTTARADGVAAIQFNDGQYLNIQGSYGSGTNTAYEVINFNAGTPSSTTYVWQFNWSGTAPNAWQMVNDIAGTSNIAASFSDPTNITSTANPSGDQNLTVNATVDNFGQGAEHFIDNFNYSGTTGQEDYWEFETGTYNAADVSSTNPQGMTWVPPGDDGLDLVTLTNGEFIGLIDDYPATDPVLPETASVPEPSQALLGTMVIACLLAIRPSRRAKA